MPHVVEHFLKVDKVGEDLTLVLQVFLNNHSAVEDQLYCVTAKSESSLVLRQQSIGLSFQSVKNDA
ncbi:hypothetical protein DPMN_162556 [Dreissena polymorpha]|uniref:Uncharacterized protein n=1 Tax=Dreissena polymorpha TaxID=45954 RepID=A0A9D4IQN3_DREPO|nr:hypothetical protein DPMN_162556 [Dreissena polymorpha]